MKHETKYYSKLQKGLERHFHGVFYRWQDETWGRPDFFGHDDKGRLIYVEVKLEDEPLRAMQRDFYESTIKVRGKYNLFPITMIARIRESKPRSTTKFCFAELLLWRRQANNKDYETNTGEVIDLA